MLDGFMVTVEYLKTREIDSTRFVTTGKISVGWVCHRPSGSGNQGIQLSKDDRNTSNAATRLEGRDLEGEEQIFASASGICTQRMMEER